MGCFLACFGFKKKRKRRKPGHKNLSGGEEGHGRYVPLDSDVTAKLDTKPEPIASDSELKENPKEAPKLKIKKKVSFNLNVKAYEPIQNYDAYLLEGDEETNLPVLRCEKDSSESIVSSYPQNYRYQKCIEGYDDEEDDIKLEESDFYYDDISDSFEELDDDYSDDELKIQDDSSMQLNSAYTKSKSQMAIERNNSPVPFHDVSNKEVQKLESNCHTRGRSVLNPVENLTQWKAIIGQARSQFKRQKENIKVEKEKEIPSITDPDSFPKLETNLTTISQLTVPVDASLSNWLVSTQKP